MSLLIKALDHLDKNKQTEKSKKLGIEPAVDAPVLLELIPVEAQKVVEEERVADAVKSIATERVAAGRSLSLEEEAGLTGAGFGASKYAKPKHAKATDKGADKEIAKPAAQAGVIKNTPHVTPHKPGAQNTIAAQAKTVPASQSTAAELNQQTAAKVFVANQVVKTPSSKSALVILGVAGALLVWLGLQGYGYIKTLLAPDIVVVKRSLPQPIVASLAKQPVETATPVQVIDSSEVQSKTTKLKVAETVAGTKAGKKISVSVFSDKVIDDTGMLEDITTEEPKKLSAKKASKSNNALLSGSDVSNNTEQKNNSQHNPVTLISKAPSSGVDPTLLAAYQAFTRGEDVAAQQQYRQVLQRDVRNVDALLGMAAIAQRQGRDADAVGWYQKVLDIDPKNTIAQSATISPQANADVIGAESRLKSLLAQQPDAANMHAALGNLYAEQNQWHAAQDAYFNASRLAPTNADYAFNLAISLDQMGKTGLALQQYQRALELLNKSGGTSPDRAQLEARIRELQ